MSQVIPNTDDVKIACVSAALRIAELANPVDFDKQRDFQKMLDNFIVAYREIIKTVEETEESVAPNE